MRWIRYIRFTVLSPGILLTCVPYGWLFFFFCNSKCNFFVGSNVSLCQLLRFYFIFCVLCNVGMMHLDVHFIYPDYNFQRTRVTSTLDDSPWWFLVTRSLLQSLFISGTPIRCTWNFSVGHPYLLPTLVFVSLTLVHSGWILQTYPACGPICSPRSHVSQTFSGQS